MKGQRKKETQKDLKSHPRSGGSNLQKGGRAGQHWCLGVVGAGDSDQVGGAALIVGTSKHLKGQLCPPLGHVFAYSCPPPSQVSCDPPLVRFLLIPALLPSQVKLYPGPTIKSRSAARRAA